MVRGVGWFLIAVGLFAFLTGDRGPGFTVMLLGALIVGAGRFLYDLLHPGSTSDGATYADYDEPPAPIGAHDELCLQTGKVKYGNEHEALLAIEHNHHSYDVGDVDYWLERAYVCPSCGWWHATSQA